MESRNHNNTEAQKVKTKLCYELYQFSFPNNALPHLGLSSASSFMYTFPWWSSMAKIYRSLTLLNNCQFVDKVILKYILQLEKLGPSSLVAGLIELFCMDCSRLDHSVQLSKLSSQWTTTTRTTNYLPSYSYVWLNMHMTEITHHKK